MNAKYHSVGLLSSLAIGFLVGFAGCSASTEGSEEASTPAITEDLVAPITTPTGVVVSVKRDVEDGELVLSIDGAKAGIDWAHLRSIDSLIERFEYVTGTAAPAILVNAVAAQKADSAASGQAPDEVVEAPQTQDRTGYGLPCPTQSWDYKYCWTSATGYGSVERFVFSMHSDVCSNFGTIHHVVKKQPLTWKTVADNYLVQGECRFVTSVSPWMRRRATVSDADGDWYDMNTYGLN